jgi:hypothetical protein
MEGDGYYRFLGSEYRGSFQGGKRHGDGTMLFITGDQYTGKWSADMPSMNCVRRVDVSVESRADRY